MKFGSQLDAALYGEWAEFYLDYNGLKKHLKLGEKKEAGYTEKDESAFVELLDKELEKIYAFQNSKYEEIKGRVQHCENAVESISKSPSMNIPDRYAEVEREINFITEELNELAKYARLNYTGIIKIVKKHDRRTHYILRPMFNVRLNACPFYKENYEPIIIQLSRLYHIVHQRLGNNDQFLSSTPNFQSMSNSWKPQTIMPAQERLLRQSRKYWVHLNNIMEVKTTILRHLPVILYKAGSDSSVTSIYFDNEPFELYQDKVDRKPGDQIIRLRWYGNKSNGGVFLERKIYETGDDEIKDRFLIKKKYVDSFLKGTYSMEKVIKKMKETPGRTDADVEQFVKLVKDIQNTIQDKNLQPVLRTYYNRMAFQIPGDNRVRISLDTDFYMIREDNFDIIRRREGEWRRSDIEDDRFDKLPSSEYAKFPYAVLEVRLNANGNEPGWVQEFLGSHLVEEAPQFSKYVHGVATLFTAEAPSLPYWLPNMDKDILKPPSTHNIYDDLSTETPASSSNYISSRRFKQTIPNSGIINVEVVGKNQISSRNKGKAVEVYNPDEEGENIIDENAPLLGGEEGGEEGQQESIVLKTFNKLFHRRSHSKTKSVILPPNVRIPQVINTQIRVEPKVYLANERTFFSWMRFSVLLGSFALALFNASGTENKAGKFCGVLYALISVSVLIYSLIKYNKRTKMINERKPGPYDDIVTPIIVCIALFIAVGLNFYLKLPRVIESSRENVNINIPEPITSA
nr:7406_t:CDS:2 [Entrophospora candida]CAG8436361.1 5586_t:CDS:2 [Entrophospora candida]